MLHISTKQTIAAIVLCLSSTLAFSQTDALVLSSGAVPPGGTASLNLSLTSGTGSEPAGLQWTLNYSPADVVAINAIPGASATAAGKVLACTASVGSYTCFLTGLNANGLNANVIQNGVVAVVTATISASTPAASISITKALGATPSGGAAPISATGGTITAVVPISLTFLTCNPTSIPSGGVSTCTVTLNQAAPAGGTSVALSDNNANLTVPASVVVPAGGTSGTFAATAGTLTTTQGATVTASLNGNLLTANLSLVAPVLVSALGCSPASVNSGASTTCTVTVNQPAPAGGATIALSVNNPLLTVPASVTVAAGSTNATFTATAGALATTETATVTAALNGSIQTANVTLVGTVLLSGLVCDSTDLDAGQSANCTVTLSAPAPTGGVAVSVSADSPALTVPASVNVPDGSPTATFAATATSTPPDGGATQTISVTAELNGASQSEPLRLVLCPCSLWPSTAQPVNPASTNKQAIEVGMQFTSNVSGYVTGVRFYKASTNKGTHLGNLWAADGTLLARVTFTGETDSGWQVAYFPSPVAITADTTYVISYHAPRGRNAADDGAFTTPVSKLPLQATADGQNGPNGVYLYGSTAFPTTGATATNYWVDAIFNTAPTIGSGAPVSMWQPSAVPNTPDVLSAKAAELGLTFMSSDAGYVTGLRFYKSPKNLGKHVGYLWTSTGTLLTSVTFTNESASGWQQANFAAPVAIDANTPYLISYWSPRGHYAADAAFFATSGLTNQMLYAPADGQYGPNGAYVASKAFPAGSSGSSNYWVDVVFTTAIQ